MRRSNNALRGVAVLLLGCLGCGTPPSKPESTGDYLASHGISMHRPRSFAAAVKQLATRRDAILSDAPPKDPALALQRLKNIVRWLPELAGDSDLRRADWEQVQQQALAMQKLIDAWQTVEQVADANARRHYDKILTELRPLAAKSVTAPHG